MAELRTIRIGDFGRVVTGKTPPSSQPELFGDVYPFLTPTDINGFSRYIEPARFLSPEGRDFQHRLMLPKRAVCIVCIGATIGKVCMTNSPSFTNQQVNSVVVNEDEYDPFFVYHLMTTLRDELKSNAGGAATPIINKTAFSEIEVNVPPLPVQRLIAGILSAYDELIENNQRRIKILEQMARALYREWFVHFRFPGHEHVARVPSPLGEIPEGWEVVPFSEIYDTASGATPSRKIAEYYGEDYPWIKTRELKDGFVLEAEENITKLGLEKSSAKLFPANTVVIAMYGATIGKLGILAMPSATNQACAAILPRKTGFGRAYAYWFLAENRKELIALGQGAAQQNISQVVIKKFPSLRPPTELAERFTVIAEPLLDLIKSLQNNIQNLRRTRDLLLPRLLSGQLNLDTE